MLNRWFYIKQLALRVLFCYQDMLVIRSYLLVVKEKHR
jgi:hypothetical protein